MCIAQQSRRHRLEDRRGVALPSALFCLLALTILVTGVLITATTEAVTSRAQQAAAEELHAAEGAIEAWISERDQHLEPEEAAEWRAPGSLLPVRLRVERLARWLSEGENPERITLFAIHAESIRGAGGGRSVVALVRIREEQLSADVQPDWGPPHVQGRTFGWFEVVR